MARYRKLPVVIDAIKFQAVNDELREFLGEDGVWPAGSEQWVVIDIETLEGHMSAKIGDYIIRGVVGELYPCKPDIFEQTYELVEEE